MANKLKLPKDGQIYIGVDLARTPTFWEKVLMFLHLKKRQHDFSCTVIIKNTDKGPKILRHIIF